MKDYRRISRWAMLFDRLNIADLLRQWRPGRGRFNRAVRYLAVPCLAMLLLLAACQNDEEGGELSGPIGPGGGGPAVVGASVVTDPLSASDGTSLGSLSFDSAYLTREFTGGTADETHYIYADSTQTTAVAVLRISGRPDSPCRFSAALLARDERYAILASGDVFNDQGLEFHQVNLALGDTYARFYCTELAQNLGVQIGTASTGGNLLEFEQVHFLLNSVSR